MEFVSATWTHILMKTHDSWTLSTLIVNVCTVPCHPSWEQTHSQHRKHEQNGPLRSLLEWYRDLVTCRSSWHSRSEFLPWFCRRPMWFLIVLAAACPRAENWSHQNLCRNRRYSEIGDWKIFCYSTTTHARLKYAIHQIMFFLPWLLKCVQTGGWRTVVCW